MKRPWVPKITRDATLFTTGLLLTVYEAVIRQGPDRPTLILLFAGMMGLPVVLRADEFRAPPGRKRDGDDEGTDEGSVPRGSP